MNPRHLIPFTVVTLACGGEPQQERDTTFEDPDGVARLTIEELPERPEYPELRSGYLVSVSAGDHEIAGSWKATAVYCEQPGVLEIYAGPQGFRTAVVIRTNSSGLLGSYTIESSVETAPEPPIAFVGVQIFDQPVAFGFQAFDGELEITETGQKVSGRFASTLREIREDIYTHYVGVFKAVDVEMGDDEYCSTFPEVMATDSTLADQETDTTEN